MMRFSFYPLLSSVQCGWVNVKGENGKSLRKFVRRKSRKKKKENRNEKEEAKLNKINNMSKRACHP